MESIWKLRLQSFIMTLGMEVITQVWIAKGKSLWPTSYWWHENPSYHQERSPLEEAMEQVQASAYEVVEDMKTLHSSQQRKSPLDEAIERFKKKR